MREWPGKAEFVMRLKAAVQEFVAEGGSIFPPHGHYTESPSVPEYELRSEGESPPFSNQESLEKQKTTRRLVSAAREG
jgi:hypothetical protein